MEYGLFIQLTKMYFSRLYSADHFSQVQIALFGRRLPLRAESTPHFPAIAVLHEISDFGIVCAAKESGNRRPRAVFKKGWESF